MMCCLFPPSLSPPFLASSLLSSFPPFFMFGVFRASWDLYLVVFTSVEKLFLIFSSNFVLPHFLPPLFLGLQLHRYQSIFCCTTRLNSRIFFCFSSFFTFDLSSSSLTFSSVVNILNSIHLTFYLPESPFGSPFCNFHYSAGFYLLCIYNAHVFLNYWYIYYTNSKVLTFSFQHLCYGVCYYILLFFFFSSCSHLPIPSHVWQFFIVYWTF